MRRHILALFLLLLASPSFAGGGALMMIGGTAAAGGGETCDSCSSGTDSLFAYTTTTYSDVVATASWIAFPFTLGGTKCITGSMFNINDGNNDRGITCEIYTNNVDKPGSIVDAGYTVTINNIQNDQSNLEILYSSTITLGAGSYWSVCKPVGGVIDWGREAATGNTLLKNSSDSGSTWGLGGSKIIGGIIGCDPS